ncbi:MAG: hypothetical protein ACFBSG_19450 [Leptolyngbyaceae cyanobacterium]
MRGIIISVGLMIGTVMASMMPAAAIARVCRAVPSIPPSDELQDFQVDAYDLSLKIPRNYRSMLRSSGHITFHDPAAFDLIQCMVRTGEYATIPPYSALEIYQGVNNAAALVDTIRLKRPWLDYYSPTYEPVQFVGQPALLYEYTNQFYGLTIANISFLSFDGRTLLTLTGPASSPLMENALLLVEAAPFTAPEPAEPRD